MAPVQRSFYLSSKDCASVIFRRNYQTVCCVLKTLVFNVFKVILLVKYPSFLGLFVWVKNPVKCNACAVNQKIVTTWFCGNALVSTELLSRIS